MVRWLFLVFIFWLVFGSISIEFVALATGLVSALQLQQPCQEASLESADTEVTYDQRFGDAQRCLSWPYWSLCH